jgi:hypothetical protein
LRYVDVLSSADEDKKTPGTSRRTIQKTDDLDDVLCQLLPLRVRFVVLGPVMRLTNNGKILTASLERRTPGKIRAGSHEQQATSFLYSSRESQLPE